MNPFWQRLLGIGSQSGPMAQPLSAQYQQPGPPAPQMPAPQWMRDTYTNPETGRMPGGYAHGNIAALGPQGFATNLRDQLGTASPAPAGAGNTAGVGGKVGGLLGALAGMGETGGGGVDAAQAAADDAQRKRTEWAAMNGFGGGWG